MKTFLRWLVRAWFRFRTFNEEVLKTPGPVLLIPNHVSWIDWLFLGVCLEDDWRFVTSSQMVKQAGWLRRKIIDNNRTFPVDTNSPYAARRMAEFLQGGGRLVLFAEGRITLTAQLMKLYDGTGFLLHKTRAKVIVCYLRNACRVRWVRHTGWKHWFPKVSAHFTNALTPPKLEGISNTAARQKLTSWLRDLMVRQRFEVELDHGPVNLLATIAETARNIPGKIILEDATGAALTYRRLMTGTDLLASEWNKLIGTGNPLERVGVLLPNVNATPAVILSLWAAGKVPAILNFSTGVPVMLACARLAGLKHIITSRSFLDKARLKLEPLTAAGLNLIYLEDVSPQIPASAKFTAYLRHLLSPGAGFQEPPSDPVSRTDSPTAVILFTSGSEGIPKGVELSHRNLLANLHQINAIFDLTDHERFFNAMPVFHSFGLTAGTLFPLMRGNYTFLYPSPLHYRVVPAAVYDRACTVLMGTNTFLNGYARRAHPYDFSSVKYLVAGAEKIQEATANTWARKFGVRLLEGYGATECSPAITLNTRMDARFGSAGRFMPGMEWKVEPVEGVAAGGRLFVRGPNVMKGYLNPEANAAFQALNGWYDTGDIARVDDDGCITILGRMKRFAKVSGEMVSLTAVEEALAGAFPQYGLRCEVAVITQPDEDKGEMLIAVCNEPRLRLEEIRAAVKAKGLTNLCMPREVKVVKDIPKLGTGKVNYRELAAFL